MNKIILFAIFLLFSIKAIANDLGGKFQVTQSMQYKGGLDLSSSGVPFTPIIYEASLLPDRNSELMASDQEIVKLIDSLPTSNLPIILDVERWPSQIHDTSKNHTNIFKLLTVLMKIKSLKPDSKFGFYGVAPFPAYWPIVSDEQKDLKKIWLDFNRIANKDFVPAIDAIYPDLYTFYNDQIGWKKYAIETLKEAKKFEKPVYCFLWPQFHDNKPPLKGVYLPTDFWRLELETCKQFADGVVIWNYEPQKEWDPNADWWKETLKFLKTLNQ